MIDNEYSRTKMRGYVMGLSAAAHMVESGDDVQIFQEDINERIKACCDEWKIKLPKGEEDEQS